MVDFQLDTKDSSTHVVVHQTKTKANSRTAPSTRMINRKASLLTASPIYAESKATLLEREAN